MLDLTFAATVGVAAGFINTLSGGGSAFSLPLLIGFGIPPHIANGTNHVALLASAVTRIAVFRGANMIDWRRGMPLLGATAAGSATGTLLATRLPDALLAAALLPTGVVALLLIVTGARHFLERDGTPSAAPDVNHLGVFFLLGAWGGLVAIGIGSFLLWTLVLMVGYGTRHAAAQKSLLMLGITTVSLTGFEIAGDVDWSMGAALASGSILGAWVGARFIVWPGSRPWIYRMLLLMAVVELVWAGIVGI